VLGIIEVQSHRLDRGYLRSMAESLGVSDLLNQALAEAER
jgi:hypothetical protein